jgi:putative intracellular protease/amidase
MGVDPDCRRRARAPYDFLAVATDRPENAGASWEDKPIIVDGTVVTSRRPDDHADFCREMVKLVWSRSGAESRLAIFFWG